MNGTPQYDPQGRFDAPLHEALFIRAPGYLAEFKWLDEDEAQEGEQRITLHTADGAVMARVILLDETGAHISHAKFATSHDAYYGPQWTVLAPIPHAGYPLPVAPGKDDVLSTRRTAGPPR